MTDAPLPTWAATAEKGASAAFSAFGIVFVLRWALQALDVAFGNGSWGEHSPLWLAVIGAVSLGLAIILGLVRVVGELVRRGSRFTSGRGKK